VDLLLPPTHRVVTFPCFGPFLLDILASGARFFSLEILFLAFFSVEMFCPTNPSGRSFTPLLWYVCLTMESCSFRSRISWLTPPRPTASRTSTPPERRQEPPGKLAPLSPPHLRRPRPHNPSFGLPLRDSCPPLPPLFSLCFPRRQHFLTKRPSEGSGITACLFDLQV